MTATLTTELRTIRVYGTLADLIGRRTFQAVVKTVRDAVKFLIANFPQVEAHIKQRHFRVKVSNWTLGEDDLSAPVGVTDEIHIIPAICGAGGDNSVLGILAGVALIGIGLFVPGAGPIFTNLGIGLLLTGISALISPTPEVPDEENDPSKSYNFSGVQNTSNEGVPVPCVYGEIVTGSVTIALGILEDEEEIEEEFEGGTGNPNTPPPPFPEDPGFCPDCEPPFPSEPQPVPGDAYGAIAVYYYEWFDSFSNGAPFCLSGECSSTTGLTVNKVAQFTWNLNGGDLGPTIIWKKSDPLTPNWNPDAAECSDLCPNTLGCLKDGVFYQYIPYRSDGVTSAKAGLSKFRYSGNWTTYNATSSCLAVTHIPKGIIPFVGYGTNPSEALLALPDIPEVINRVDAPPEGYDDGQGP